MPYSVKGDYTRKLQKKIKFNYYGMVMSSLRVRSGETRENRCVIRDFLKCMETG